MDIVSIFYTTEFNVCCVDRNKDWRTNVLHFGPDVVLLLSKDKINTTIGLSGKQNKAISFLCFWTHLLPHKARMSGRTDGREVHDKQTQNLLTYAKMSGHLMFIFSNFWIVFIWRFWTIWFLPEYAKMRQCCFVVFLWMSFFEFKKNLHLSAVISLVWRYNLSCLAFNLRSFRLGFHYILVILSMLLRNLREAIQQSYICSKWRRN